MSKANDSEKLSPEVQVNFDELYAAFWPKIHRYVTRLVGSQEAEDLTQDIFIKASQAADTFRNKSQLSTWIYRIATNAAIDKIRSNHAVKKATPMNEDGKEIDINIAKLTQNQTDSVPEKQVIQEEMNSCIRGFIDELPEIYRTVIILSEYEGLKNKEIAEVSGLSLDVVKIRLHRARTKLKRDFSKNCHFYRDERNVLACEPKMPD